MYENYARVTPTGHPRVFVPRVFDKRRVKNSLLNRFKNRDPANKNELRDSSRRNALEVNALKFVRVNGSRIVRACAFFRAKERGLQSHFRMFDCIDD